VWDPLSVRMSKEPSSASSGLEPGDRGKADVEGARNIHQRFPRLAADQRLAPLLFCELGFAAQAHVAQFGAFTALGRASSAQVPLDIGQAARYCNHETPSRRRGVSPRLGQRPELSLLVDDGLNDGKEVESRSGMDTTSGYIRPGQQWSKLRLKGFGF
jgi:hypothetical protein